MMELDALEQTLEELCHDLLAADAAVADADAILQSLAALARTFPAAQRRLGRLLASRAVHTSAARRHSDGEAPTRFALLATRFLYRRETAQSAMALLAALADGNVANQQRIVRSVAGVVLEPSLTPRTHDAVRATVFAAGKIKRTSTRRRLLVLTVPDAIKREFQRWRRRQQELQHHRIPSGVAPEQGGVPRPCLCNDCLGREQFLATWQLHFADLSRWTIDRNDDDDERCASARPAPLSARAFFHVFLQDFCIYAHNFTAPDALAGAREAEASARTSRLFYYFAKCDASAPAPAFDPLEHVSALALAAAVDVSDRSELQAVATSAETRAADDGNGDATYDAVERVLLLERRRAAVATCAHRRTPARCRDVQPQASTCSGRIARFVRSLDMADSAGCVSVRQLTTALCVDEADECAQLCSLDRHVLTAVVSFLDSDSDTVAIAALCGVLRDSEGDAADARALAPCDDDQSTRDVSVQIFASVATQELLVRCSYEEHDGDSKRVVVFSAAVPHECLESRCSTDAARVDPLALLCVPDEALDAMLACCRLCECSSQLLETASDPAEELLYLRRDDSDDDTGDRHDADSAPQSPQMSPIDKPTAPPIKTHASVPGLSSDLTAALAELHALVETARAPDSSSESPAKSRRPFATKFHATLASLITRCNARVTELASSSIVGVPEAHRRAGMDRCRSCRDVLIELGKRVRLVLEPGVSSTSASDSVPSPDVLDRIAKLVRKSLARVEALSASVHAWETLDDRVEKLQLNRRVWASGFPDPEFYRERETQTRANQATQRQLSRLLVHKQQQQRKRTKA